MAMKSNPRLYRDAHRRVASLFHLPASQVATGEIAIDHAGKDNILQQHSRFDPSPIERELER